MSTGVVSNLSPDLEDVAERFANTLQAGDVDGWLATYAEDAVAWHSYDGVEMSPADNTELLRGLFASVVSELRYADIRRYQIEDGYVQQHTLHMTSKTGATYQIGACIVVKVIDGKVQRLDEYLDSGVFQFSAPSPDTAS